jgi:hypothetical protein
LVLEIGFYFKRGWRRLCQGLGMKEIIFLRFFEHLVIGSSDLGIFTVG